MKTFVLFFDLLLVAGLFLSACDAKAQGVERNDPTGVYILVSVDGAKLPATVFHDEVKIEVRSGVFTINADGTCSSKNIFGPPSGDEITREVNASYTQTGSTLNMQWKGAGRTVGTIQDDRFTMDNEGIVFSYKKQPTLPASSVNAPSHQSSEPKSPELKVLDRMVGTWRSESVIKQANGDEKKYTEDIVEKWSLQGQYIESRSTDSDGKLIALNLITFDSDEGVYKIWTFLPELPKPLVSKLRWNESKTSFTGKGDLGNGITTQIVIRFIGNDRRETTVTAKDASGNIMQEYKGKPVRKK
jgi:hypothetical protein